jgi:hypothetical protein
MLGQRIVIGIGVLGLTILPGCYGSTEPATDIGVDAATLNANGSTEDSPTTSWFEYWRTSQPGSVDRTEPRHLPAHVRGPFRIRVGGSEDLRASSLAPDTEYSFRFCGETEGVSAVCAQTRTFRTLQGDLVRAVLHAADVDAWLRAVSGPNGESADGHLDVALRPSPEERVVCLSVTGDEAVVGLRSPGGDKRTLGLLAGSNPVTQDFARDPASCASVRPGDLPATQLSAETQIHDGS